MEKTWNCFITQPSQGMIPIKPLLPANFDPWYAVQSEQLKRWATVNRFNAEPGSVCLMPNTQGELQQVLMGVSEVGAGWMLGDLPSRLPAGDYYLDLQELALGHFIGWGLGSYSFNEYRKQTLKLHQPQPRLLIPESIDAKLCQTMVDSLCWVRNLINFPAEDCSPQWLAEVACQLAKESNGSVEVISGEDLITANYPALHAVGRASSRPPCLIDLRWPNSGYPLITLVGKGICFDSGGLNLKSSDGMRIMKKDMAGAAHALGLARIIINQKLPVALRVLIPAADNVLSGSSYRPGDVIVTRAGISVEISNTDAEGRLVVCDALAAAAAESPELLLDFTTLTGAARIALGPEVPVFFTQHEDLATELMRAAEVTAELLWRLPLYTPYERYLKSNIADLCNSSEGPYAGAITAALYLKRFVPSSIPWAHFDMSAWNFDKLPGRPVGGEAMGLRTVYAYLASTYCKD